MNSKKNNYIPVLLLILLYAIVLLRTAWAGDDAYIIFRTVDNFVNGYGLRWNIAERVQAYTCPLWMFLLSGVYYITREIYFSAIFLSIFISVATITIICFKIVEKPAPAFVAISILISSQAFVDYSTSGLENPLSHLIIVLFLLVYLKTELSITKIFFLSLLASLSVLNRMDTILLYLPALAYACWKMRSIKCVCTSIIGFTPFILWECFSIIYYGFPFPNTAYAKLGTGISSSELMQQGLSYLLNSVNTDPLTLLVIITGVAIVILTKNKQFIPLAVGIIFYLLYIIRIGGDFMSGRFLTIALLCSTVMLVKNYSNSFNAKTIVSISIIFIAGLTADNPNILYSANKQPWKNKTEPYNDNGIENERMFYCSRSYGLATYKQHTDIYENPIVDSALNIKYSGKNCITMRNVGLRGYCVGPNVHIIDIFALADPLLARMPAFYTPSWRIGHFQRRVPDGYIDTIEKGTNMFVNRKLSNYYDKLYQVIKGPIFRLNRFRTILNMNLGKYDHLIDYSKYRYGHIPSKKISEVNCYKKEGASWNTQGNYIIGTGGIIIDLEGKYHNHYIKFSADNDDSYLIVIMDENTEIERLKTAKIAIDKGISICLLEISENVARKGYDKILMVPLRGNGKYSIGYLKLLNSNPFKDERMMLSDISAPKENGTPWNSGNIIITNRGLSIDLKGEHFAKRLEISADNNDKYEIAFYKMDKKTGVKEMPNKSTSANGLFIRYIDVPEEVVVRGFDRIHITPIKGDGKYSIGHVKLLEE